MGATIKMKTMAFVLNLLLISSSTICSNAQNNSSTGAAVEGGEGVEMTYDYGSYTPFFSQNAFYPTRVCGYPVAQSCFASYINNQLASSRGCEYQRGCPRVDPY